MRVLSSVPSISQCSHIKKNINPFHREAEKINTALEWIANFHFTTQAILAKRLTISENTTWRLIKKLKANGFIRGIEVYTIRHELLLLTPAGLNYVTEQTEKLYSYSTEPSKINVNQVRHNLSVQLVVASRLQPEGHFIPERLLHFENQRKIPDAIIESKGTKLALEIELHPKTDERIYIGFENHLKALHAKLYDQVEYIFKTDSLKEYYLKRFSAKTWPVYNWSSKDKRWLLVRNHSKDQQLYFPEDDKELTGRFLFRVADFSTIR